MLDLDDYTKTEKRKKHSHPLLVLPAFDEGWVGGNVGDGVGGVPVPQVEPHLEIADHHAHHGEEVGHQEEEDVVPGELRLVLHNSGGGCWASLRII